MLINQSSGCGCTTSRDNNVEYDPMPTTKRGKRRSNARPAEGLRYAHTNHRKNKFDLHSQKKSVD